MAVCVREKVWVYSYSYSILAWSAINVKLLRRSSSTTATSTWWIDRYFAWHGEIFAYRVGTCVIPGCWLGVPVGAHFTVIARGLLSCLIPGDISCQFFIMLVTSSFLTLCRETTRKANVHLHTCIYVAGIYTRQHHRAMGTLYSSLSLLSPSACCVSVIALRHASTSNCHLVNPACYYTYIHNGFLSPTLIQPAWQPTSRQQI